MQRFPDFDKKISRARQLLGDFVCFFKKARAEP
jgi:hypothetical protein